MVVLLRESVVEDLDTFKLALPILCDKELIPPDPEPVAEPEVWVVLVVVLEFSPYSESPWDVVLAGLIVGRFNIEGGGFVLEVDDWVDCRCGSGTETEGGEVVVSEDCESPLSPCLSL